ncbi:MAG: carboxypeptidase-like regulatory domain-containing protein, partial [Marinirhabdus sp.]
VHFIDRNSIAEPHYEGKLYIDSENLALTSASYRLNVGNKRAASKIFVQKKPRDVNVYPTQARYKVDYREKNGKWYYGYGRVDLSFKVNKRRKLFNTVYSLSSEMAVTDITDTSPGQFIQNKMKPTVVMADAVSGFSDPDFWGPYNVIEPEKSIESAISKIQRKMQRNN